jgi:hypothetical protein
MQLSILSLTTPLMGSMGGVVGIFLQLALKFRPGGRALAHAHMTFSGSFEALGLMHTRTIIIRVGISQLRAQNDGGN